MSSAPDTPLASNDHVDPITATSAAHTRAPRWQFGLGRQNGLAFWALLLLEASFGSYFALWPLWIEDRGAAVWLVGLLIGMGGILRLAGLLPSAWLVRRFGLRTVFVTVRLIAAVGIFTAALAPSWPWLIPAFIGMAIGDVAFPVAATFVSRNGGAQRVRAFTMVFTFGPSIALLATPLLSGVLVKVWGLRAPFVAAAVFSVISAWFFFRTQSAAAPDDDHSGGSGYAALLRLPGLRLLFGIQFATFFAIGLGTSLLPIFLHEVHGYREAIIPPLTALTAVGSIVLSTAIARSKRLSANPLRSVSGAVFLAAVSFAMFLSADLLPLALLAMTLRGGFFVAWPLYNAVLGERSPDALRPHTYALGEILAGTGFVLAPIGAGQLYGIDSNLPIIVAVAMLIPLIGGIWALSRHNPTSPPTPAAATDA